MPLFKLLLYFLPLIYVTCSNLLLPTSRPPEFLQKCVDQIQNIYFKSTDFVLFLNLNVLLEDLKINLKTVVTQSSYGKKLLAFHLVRADVYVITISTKIIKNVFEFLVRSSEWNPRAKFVIILEGNIGELFSILKTYHVLNVIVLRLKSETETEILTYFAYDFTVPESERSREVLLDVCLQGELKKNVNLFPEKLPKFWTNTTVRLALVKYPPYVQTSNCNAKRRCGVEPDIFKKIQNMLGFKINYVNTSYENWGHKERNGSYVGGSKGLQNREFDVGIGAYFPNSSESWDFDLTHSYFEDSFNWVVPASKLQPRWKTHLKSFHIYIWILILVCYFIASLVLYFVALYFPEFKRYKSVSSCFTICFECMFTQGVRLLPKTPLVRVIFVAWVLFSYIISITIQSKLTESLNFNIYEKQLSTIEELIESELQFGFYPDSGFQFSYSKNKIDSYIYKNFIPCSRGSDCTNRTALKRDFATIKTQRYLNFMITNYFLDSNGRPLLYVFKNNVRGVLITMAFVKGFPIIDQINELLLKFKAYGIIAHYYSWIKDVEEKARQKAQNIKTHVGGLTMKECETTFYLLMMGLAAALVVFVLEYNVILLKKYLRVGLKRVVAVIRKQPKLKM